MSIFFRYILVPLWWTWKTLSSNFWRRQRHPSFPEEKQKKHPCCAWLSPPPTGVAHQARLSFQSLWQPYMHTATRTCVCVCVCVWVGGCAYLSAPTYIHTRRHTETCNEKEACRTLPQEVGGGRACGSAPSLIVCLPMVFFFLCPSRHVPSRSSPDAYGHTTGNTPEPVRFQKLSLVRPS